MTTAQIRLWHEAIDQFNREEFFECHETLEMTWRNETDAAHRDFMQGFIHIAAAFFHLRNKNNSGYLMQLRKGIQRFERVNICAFEKQLNVNMVGFIGEVSVNDRDKGFPKISFTASAASL